MNDKILKFLPLGFAVLCLLVRFLFLTFFPVQHDEPFSIFTANLCWQDFWVSFQTENNPPLHLLLLKIVQSFFGLESFPMRLLSVCFSAASVYFVYLSIKKISTPLAASIASILMIFSDLQQMWSHQIRAYSLMVLLASVSFCFLIKLLQKEWKWSFLAFAFVNALLLYTHFMGILCVGFLSVSVIIFWKDKEIRNKLLLSFVLTALLFLPYLPTFFQRFLWVRQDSWQRAPTEIMAIYYTFWQYFNVPLATVFAILIFIGGGTFLAIKKQLSPIDKLVIFMVLASFLGVFGLSFIVPIYYNYYLLFVTPFLYGILGIIVFKLVHFVKNQWVKYIFITLLPLVMLFSFKINADVQHERTAEWKIIAEQKNAKAVVFSPAWRNKDYCYHLNKEFYYTKTLQEFGDKMHKNLIFEDYFFVTWQHLYPIKGKSVFVFDDDPDPTPELDKMLNDKFTLVKEHTKNLKEYLVK
jgi:4-amino-4-deoxy-L-arabinose transferase-like glycosyltransferase